MKKKGFTLVELLAVIAILAILVVIALPNVLGMFNTAKTNSFVTEVQKMMDTAKTQWTLEQMSGASAVTFASGMPDGVTVADAKTLDLDGNSKTYQIKFDSQGKITEVFRARR